MEQLAPCIGKGHGVPKVVRRGRTSCTGNSHARLLLVAAALPLGASLADRDRWFCGSAASGKLFSHVELADGKCYFTVSLAVKELTNAGVVTFGEQRSMAGGDRDEHGCIPSAGYSWCEELGQCIRAWETNCSQGCFGPCAYYFVTTFGAFSVIAMACHTLSQLLAPLGLPLVTICIAFGVSCGPYGFDLIHEEDILILDWIGDMALGFIGLLAGGHLRVTEMASSLSTALVLVAVTALVTYLGMLAVILSFGGLFIPLFGVLSQPQELAIAMLVASLSVARSADALIAIITELNAKGPFTTIILAVTIMIDIIVVVVFAITLEVARVIDQHAMAANVLEVVSDTIFGGRRLEGEIGDMILDDAIGRRRLGSTDEAPMTAPSSADGHAPHGHLVQTILFDFSSKMLVSLVLGYLLAHLLTHLLTRKAQPATWPAQGAMDGGLGCTALGMALGLLLRAPLAALQTASLPTSGWLLFYGQEVSEEEGWAWSFDPLFTAIVAGFIIVNYTRGGQAFDETCHLISRPIFLLFFVFIGVSMKLNLLVHNLSACLFIFFSRLALIIIGTRLGGHLAGSPVEHSNMYWMGLFTQAGVTIGLAHHAAFYFAWGPDFAAMIIGAAVLNQIFGPPLTKYAIRVAGEDSAAVLSPSAAVGAPSAEARVTEML